MNFKSKYNILKPLYVQLREADKNIKLWYGGSESSRMDLRTYLNLLKNNEVLKTNNEKNYNYLLEITKSLQEFNEKTRNIDELIDKLKNIEIETNVLKIDEDIGKDIITDRNQVINFFIKFLNSTSTKDVKLAIDKKGQLYITEDDIDTTIFDIDALRDLLKNDDT